MEIAIPLLALGGIYVISNQNNESSNKKEIRAYNKENFTSMGLRNEVLLPNTNNPPQNYPVTNVSKLIETVQEYPNPNVATDKYFNQNAYEKKTRNNLPVGNTPQDIYSLTGNFLNSEQFKHNNMTPFYGGKIKGNTYDVKLSESVLDNMNGAGTHVIKKIEQAPLFKPEQNVQWTYGMPNQSDFYQSRVNPGMKNNNVKPFESEMVGPGLNQGYGINGSGGFNSGMEARDKWLPKTVDQLRVETNPKMEYNLDNLEGPASSFIKNIPTTQLLGRIEKQRPDTFFINSQDRWLTTTGAEKGETLRSIQELGMVKRFDSNTNYQGAAGAQNVKSTYAPENYEASRKVPLEAPHVAPSMAKGQGMITDGDKFKQSYSNPENNRTTTHNKMQIMGSGFNRAISAVIAPVMDAFRPTRKEETINNIRIYGDTSTSVSKSYVYNPQDTTNTTIKETTLYQPNFNINNQKESMYVNTYSQPDLTQRDTTSSEYFTAAGGASTGYGDVLYDSSYRQHNNDIKSSTINNRLNQGGTQIFNQQMNLTNIKNDTDRLDGRFNPAYSRLSGMPPSVRTFGSVHAPQYNDECIVCDRIQPDILTAFKNNPYTHSLSSAV